jgi:hypothetical protein
VRVQARQWLAAWCDIEIVEEDERLDAFAQAGRADQAVEPGLALAAGTVLELARRFGG